MNNLIKNYHFQVEWGGIHMGFSKVAGLNFSRETIEYRLGNSKEDHTFKVPGRTKFGNITLKRGMTTGDNSFFEWWMQAQSNNYKRDLSIALLDETFSPVVVWRVRNAFPVKLECSELDAVGNDIVIETLEITHEGLSIEFTS
ncbi:MAG: phage tail protein [Saprospiraceae bacterium]